MRKREVDPGDARGARAAALDALARRDHATEALRRKLGKKGYDAEVVSAVIGRLRDEKLLDDRRYVGNFVTYHADRGHGALRVRAKLRRLGIDGEIVEECLSAFGDWAGSAERARRKKFGAMRPTIPADQQRQARFLAHRGFTGTEIGAAVGVDTELELDQELI